MEHSKYGYSAINQFNLCPYLYDMKWNKHVEVIDDYNPKDPLIVGTALHRAIETDYETAEKEYFEQFPVISDDHITEMLKIEIQSKKVKELIESSGNPLLHEVRVECGEFIGTIDLLEDLGVYEMNLNQKDNVCSECKFNYNCGYCNSGRCPKGKYHNVRHYNLYDFKYTNYPKNYENSIQLMVYKYFFEKTHPGCVIDNMYFIIVPKSTISDFYDNGDVWEYRQKIINDLKDRNPRIIESTYYSDGIIEYFNTVEKIKKTNTFEKQRNQFCHSCKYNKLCMKGEDYMVLPSNERRPVGGPTKRKIWIYGASMSGKTTFLDSAPDPLNLNTDGNIQFVSMPYIPIKDEVVVEGRITKRTFAWEVFKDAIAELEKKQNSFKTIIVDLIEDTREMCRLYKYDELGIQHESDSGYGKGWDIIKTEYLSVIRRLFNLDYENIIVVSHETVSEVKKKNGQTITKIAPNIQESLANKIAGMVDIVARVVVEDDGTRTLNFKSNEYIFGGGRLKNLQTTNIPLDWEELMKVYDCKPTTIKAKETPSEAVTEGRKHTPKDRPAFKPSEDGEPLLPKKKELVADDFIETDDSDDEVIPFDKEEPAPKTRTRRSRITEPEAVAQEVEKVSEIVESAEAVEITQTEEAPKRRTRRTRA